MGRNARLKHQRRIARQAVVVTPPASTAAPEPEPFHGGGLFTHLTLICALAFALSIFLIESEDIFSNIVTGEFLWKTGSLPELDPFSFTGPHRWLLNRPLPCVIFYLVHSIGGLPAIQIFCGLMIAATYGIFYVVWSRRTRQPLVVFAVTALMVMASCYWFQTRIYVFAYLYAVISLFLITSKSPERMWWAYPLQVLWINSHPSAIIGVFFTGVWWFVLSYRARRFEGASTLILLGVIAANIISPMGFSAYGKFAEEIFGSHPSRENIFEWFSPFSETVSHQPLALWFYGACCLMVFLAVFGMFSTVSLGISPVLLIVTGALFVMAAGSSRHIPLFYFAFVGVLITCLTRWIEAGRVTIKPIVGLVVTACVAVAVIKVAALGYSSGNGKRTFTFGVDPYKFPEKAIQILKSAKVEGNVFSDYDTGAYFLYRMYPDYKVYIDGARLDEVYGEEGFLHYMRLGNDLRVLKDDIEKYDIRAFIIPLPPTESEIVVVHRFLSTDPDWKLAYFDDVNMLYVKREEAQRAGIPTYAFLNPFASIEDVVKKNPDASAGFERDFKQGDVINPESIAFLILKHAFFTLHGWQDKTPEIVEKMHDLCARTRASPACGQVRLRFGV